MSRLVGSNMFNTGIDLRSVRVVIMKIDASQTVRDAALRFNIGKDTTHKMTTEDF